MSHCSPRDVLRKFATIFRLPWTPVTKGQPSSMEKEWAQMAKVEAHQSSVSFLGSRGSRLQNTAGAKRQRRTPMTL